LQTMVAVRNDGRWQLAAFQNTRVRPIGRNVLGTMLWLVTDWLWKWCLPKGQGRFSDVPVTTHDKTPGSCAGHVDAAGERGSWFAPQPCGSRSRRGSSACVGIHSHPPHGTPAASPVHTRIGDAAQAPEITVPRSSCTDGFLAPGLPR